MYRTLLWMLTIVVLSGGGIAAAETTLVWSDLLDGGGSATDNGRLAVFAPDGDLIVGGETTERLGGSAFFIRKVDHTDGGQIWSQRMPAPDGSDMFVTGLELDGDGDVIVGGYVGGCGGT